MDDNLKTGLAALLQNLQRNPLDNNIIIERDLQNINALLIDRKTIETLVQNLRHNTQLRDLLSFITSYLCTHKQPLSTTTKCVVILSNWAQHSSILRELINEDVIKFSGLHVVDFISHRVSEPIEDSALIKVSECHPT